MKFIIQHKYLLLTLVVLIAPLGACSGGNGTTEVSQAWTRPAAAGGNSAVYFSIENGSGEDEELLGASASVAGATEIHRSMAVEEEGDMTMGEGGVMQMRPQDSVLIPAGSSVTFEPGGLHVMLIGLGDDLAAGDQIELTLNFRGMGEYKLTVPVEER